MTHASKLAAAAIILLFATAGCADRVSRSFIAQPKPGEFSLSGRVRLLARLAGDASGDSLGVRAVDDASGVRVRLEFPDGDMDSTLTRDGAFHFRVSERGLYRVSCAVFPAETLATAQVTVEGSDVVIPDTLTLYPDGRVTTYPNPFPSNAGLAIECTVPSPQTVGMTALTLSGVPVRTDSIANYPAGFFHYHWIGVDDAQHALPSGMYWVGVRLDGVHHLDLVMKE